MRVLWRIIVPCNILLKTNCHQYDKKLVIMLFVESLEESLLLDEGLAKLNDSSLGKKLV